MKWKIIGILVCMLLIATAIPAIGTMDIGKDPVFKGSVACNGSDWYSDIMDSGDDVGFNTRNWTFRLWDDENDGSISCCDNIIDDLKDKIWDKIPWIIETIDCGGNNGNKQKIPGIDIYQVNYNWEKSTYKNSNTGEIIVDIDKVKKATGLESGYINAYSDQGWIIQNLVFLENFPYPQVSRFFNLGQTGEIKTINVYIDITAEPVSYFEYSGVMPPYPVLDTTYDAEGGNESVDHKSIWHPWRGGD